MGHRKLTTRETGELLRAWQRLKWLDGDARPQSDAADCLLQRSLRELRGELAACLLERLQDLHHTGYSLYAGWPRPWNTHDWIGHRLFMAPSRWLRQHVALASMACSQLGRNQQQLPRWPELVETGLCEIAARKLTLLVVSKTTLAAALVDFSRRSSIPAISILYDEGLSLEQWLLNCLRAEPLSAPTHPLPIWMSPSLERLDRVQPAAPLQDLLTFALADQVYTLLIRPSGRLEALVSRRLRQTDFPTASVFISMSRPPYGSERPPSRKSLQITQRNLQWLDMGGVGWYVPAAHDTPMPSNCRFRHRPQHRSRQQLCAPIKALSSNAAEWRMLTHCTRGAAGPRPGESESSYRARLRVAGRVSDTHPLRTLHEICEERQIRGSRAWTRGGQLAVSLSAVPVAELLRRRTYRTHLGRWDWEPYGLLFDREALESLGARPVIYGNEDDFQHLPSASQPYFQPTGDRHDWSQEQEWRFLGNLRLNAFPKGCIRLFVKTQAEAHALARQYDWPVFWLD